MLIKLRNKYSMKKAQPAYESLCDSARQVPESSISTGWSKDVKEGSLWDQFDTSQMDPEMREAFTKKGEQMYGNIDFETGDILKDDNELGGYKHIVHCLRSGLHPSAMTPEERRIVEIVDGEEWWLKYGYDNYVREE
jgi:hypothetical protein